MSRRHSLSFLLLPEAAVPSSDDFHEAWHGVANGATPPIVTAWGTDSIELELDGLMTIAALIAAPVPNQEAEAAAAHSLSSMCAGGFTPAPHVAHLLVTTASPSAAPLFRLTRHTRIVAALAKAARATGIYEGEAHATHAPDFYAGIVSSEQNLPLMLWNGVSIARSAATIEVLTLGMAQLELPDLLLVAPAGQGNDALPFAFDLLSYVVSRGGAIPEGETVGRTATEKLPVTYVPSPIDAGTQVMRVELPRPRKGWWPFGNS